MADAPTVLEVRDLRTVFRTAAGPVHAVNDVSFDLCEGEVLGVLGEAGTGKTALALSLLGLLPSPPAQVSGRAARLGGRDLLGLRPAEMRQVLGARAGFVAGDPRVALNPMLTVGFQIMEPLGRHLGLGRRQARARAAEFLALAGVPDAGRRLGDYPHQLSDAMRLRAVIAMALAPGPRLLIADDPTAALDPTAQAEILDLVAGLARRLGLAVIWVARHPGAIARIADRVIVMHGGQVVEHAPREALFRDPRHPYSQALLAALPRLREESGRLGPARGRPPILLEAPDACTFRERCPYAFGVCHRLNPQRYPVSEDHDAACFLVDPGLAPPAPAPELAHA